MGAFKWLVNSVQGRRGPVGFLKYMQVATWMRNRKECSSGGRVKERESSGRRDNMCEHLAEKVISLANVGMLGSVVRDEACQRPGPKHHTEGFNHYSVIDETVQSVNRPHQKSDANSVFPPTILS